MDMRVEEQLVNAEADLSDLGTVVDVPVGAVGPFQAIIAGRDGQDGSVLDPFGLFGKDGGGLITQAAADAGGEPGS